MLDIDSILFSTNFCTPERFAQFYTQSAHYIKPLKKQSELIL